MENQPTQEPTREQKEAIALQNYAQKRADGTITLGFIPELSVVRLTHKLFDPTNGQQIDSFTLDYVSSTMGLSRLNSEQHVAILEQEARTLEVALINKNEEIRRIKAAKSQALTDLEADVRALENEHQPSAPQLDPRSQAKRDAEAAANEA